MKTERNILIAFLLNLSFSVFEFAGGIFTGSVAIVSDALHDVGDAASIGLSYFLERKSKKQPDEKFTYGYARYSVIGGLLTTLILILGSVIMIYSAVNRMIDPAEINYNGMIVFAVAGVCVNLCAAFFTREGNSMNQKAVNLHMLEDVLGWVVVLIGAVTIQLTKFSIIDPIMSIGVSLFILVGATRNLKDVVDVLLEKTPHDIDAGELKKHIEDIEDVYDVHHIHLWSLDGRNNLATMHVIIGGEPGRIKDRIRAELRSHGIGHATIEIESSSELCGHEKCHVEFGSCAGCFHHQHHSHP